MKNTLTLIGSFIMILAAVVCTFGAVISGFSFEIDAGFLFVVWFFVALALSVAATLWRGKGILALILPVLGIVLWKLPEIADGAKWVVFFISREFNKWLVVPILFPGAKASVYEATLFFAAAGILAAFLLTIAVCLRRSAFLAVFITVPIVFVTFILIHSQPNYLFLAGLLAVYLTLLISGGLHSDDFQKRGAAIFPSLALALLLMGVAYLIAPPDGYRREIRMESIDLQLRNIASRIGLTQVRYGVGWPPVTPNEWRFDTNTVNVSNAGTRIITNQTILGVTASEPGTFYLRGYSMQHFEGGQWTVNSDTLPFPEETTALVMPNIIANNYLMLYGADAPISIKTVNMTIRNIRDTTESVTYMPYYSSYNTPYSSRLADDFIYTQESILSIPQEGYPFVFGPEALYSYGMQSRGAYTQIDEYTAEGLRRLAVEEGIDITADRGSVVDQVAQYIRSSGRYTLTPYIIPDNEDFALYFLTESKQGYCVHFATVATLMLRALDIPARFTSGFVATVPQSSVGTHTPVTDGNAHAWVEVYYNEAGWLPLEVTPEATGVGIPGFRPHSSEDTTTPAREDSAPGNTQDTDSDRPPREGTGAGENQTPQAGDDEQEQTENIWDIISAVLFSCLAVCAAAMALRRPIERIYRKKRFAQNNTNAAVICAWRYITRLGKKNAPPEEIEELAFKARFSQHTISEEERGVMINIAENLASEAYRSSGVFGRVWLYIRGI